MEEATFLAPQDASKKASLSSHHATKSPHNETIEKNVNLVTHPKKPSLILIFIPVIMLIAMIPFFGLPPSLLIAALVFEVVNGFHDVSNVVAPLVRSHTLSYRSAVLWSTICTALPVLMIGIASAKIAHAIGSSLFLEGTLTQAVMFSGVVAAFSWGLTTWAYGLPSSSSHSLMGGLAGASMMTAYISNVPIFDHLLTAGWIILIASMVCVPFIAGFFAYITSTIAVYYESKASNVPDAHLVSNDNTYKYDRLHGGYIHKYYMLINRDFSELFSAFKNVKKWPMLAASGVLSFAHSRNDGQKAMPMVAGVIYSDPTRISVFVQLLCYSAITLGTLMGGSVIMKKLNAMGHNHKPSGGIISMFVTTGVVGLATEFGVGVSTTQTTASAIMGTSYARTKEIIQIMSTWIMTPISSGVLAAVIVFILHKI